MCLQPISIANLPNYKATMIFEYSTNKFCLVSKQHQERIQLKPHLEFWLTTLTLSRTKCDFRWVPHIYSMCYCLCRGSVVVGGDYSPERANPERVITNGVHSTIYTMGVIVCGFISKEMHGNKDDGEETRVNLNDCFACACIRW